MTEIRYRPDVGVKKPIAIILSMQETQWENLTTISNNLSNTFHPGYKGTTLNFKEVMYKTRDGEQISYVSTSGVSQDFSDGSIKPTDNPLDVALTGDAFFMVATQNGTRYTRNGQFTIDAGGRLVMAATGLPVLNDGGSEISFPPDARNIRIDPDGSYAVNEQRIGKLGMAQFNKRALLQPEGNSLYKTDQEAQPATDYYVTQFGLEESNVSPIKETIKMMEALRRYEGAQKVIDEHEQILKRTLSVSARNA